MPANSKTICLTVRLRNELYYRLRNFADSTGATKAGAIEKAVDFFLAHVSVTVTSSAKLKNGSNNWMVTK